MNPAEQIMNEEINKHQLNLPQPESVHPIDATKSLPISNITNPEIVINAVYSLASNDNPDNSQQAVVKQKRSCSDTLQKNFPILLSSLATVSENLNVLSGQELVSSEQSSCAVQNNKSTAGSSGSVQSFSLGPRKEGDIIHYSVSPGSNPEHNSPESKRDDNTKGLSDSNHVGSAKIVSEISSQVKNNHPPEVVDVEAEDIEDCLLIKIDLSKRICKFGPVISEEVVIEDSDEEVCVNKESNKPMKSSELEMSSSSSQSVSYLNCVSGEKMMPETSLKNPSISTFQNHREESPTLDMEVENIKEEILIDAEQSDASDDEDVPTEKLDSVNWAEKPVGHSQNLASAESSPYSCKPCSKSFPNRTSLVTHILACHMTKPPPKELLEKLVYPCQNCSQLFRSDSLLLNHECSSCNIKSHVSTQQSSGTSLCASTSKVTLAPCSQNNTNSRETTQVTVKLEVADTTEEFHKDENLSFVPKEKATQITKNIPKEKEAPITKINQSHENNAENKAKNSSTGAASSSASTLSGDKNKPAEQPRQRGGGEKTVWCYACSSWFTTYTELKLHLKIKPQCKVTNDEFYLQNVKNKTVTARSYVTRGCTENKSQPAKSSDDTISTVNNKSQSTKSSDTTSTISNKPEPAKSSDTMSTISIKSHLSGNDKLTVVNPVLNVNNSIRNEIKRVVLAKPKVEPLKIKIGPRHCFSKPKKVCAPADQPCIVNVCLDDSSETSKPLCKECGHEFSSQTDLQIHAADQKCPMTDKKLNRAVVKLESMSVMCKVCQMAFTDKQMLSKHLHSSPNCSNKAAEQCKSCLCWFLNIEDLSKHALMSKSCQVGSSKEIANNDLSGLICDSITGRMDQQPVTGDVKMDLSSDDDSDDEDEMSSSEEGDVEYKCRHCNMVFAQKSRCKNHMNKAHGLSGDKTNNEEKVKKLRCKACTRKFGNVTLLQAHLLQSKCCFLAVTYCYWNAVQNEKHLCLLCTKIFPSDKSLRKHCFKNMACRLSYTSLVLKGVMDDKTSSPVLDTKAVINISREEGNSILPVRDVGVTQPVMSEVSSSVQDLNVSSSVGATHITLKTSQSGWGAMRNKNNFRVCKNCGANYDTFVDHILKENACCSYYADHVEESPTDSVCFRCKTQFPTKRMFKSHLCSNASQPMSETETRTASASQIPSPLLSGSEASQSQTPLLSTQEFPCMICDAKFQILRQLLEHSYQHTNQISQVCQRCNMSFSHYNRYVSHMAFHIRMDKESGLMSEQATESAKIQLSTVSDSQCLNSEAAQSFQCSVCQQKFDEISVYRDHMASNVHSRQTSHSCPICFQIFKSKEAVDVHKKSHEISRTSPLVDLSTPTLDLLPATEKKTISKFPQLCDICNKHLNSPMDKKKHISCSARCRKALSNLQLRKEMAPDQVRDDDTDIKNSSPSSEELFKCIFCLQEFSSDKDKLEHISKSQCCKSILKFVMDNKLYAIPQDFSDSCKKLHTNSKRCEFCLKIIEDKVTHLLGSVCIKALENAIIAYKSNADMKVSHKNSQYGTVKVSLKNSQDATNKHSHSCEICQQMFSTKGLLSRHKRKKHQEMDNHLHLPEKDSNKQQTLSNVPTDHHLFCFTCKTFLETANDVELHSGLSHRGKLLSRGTMNNAVFTPGQLMCKICNIKYLGKRSILINHMHAKHNEGTSKLLDLHSKLLHSKKVPALSSGDTSPKTADPDPFPPNLVFSCGYCGMVVRHKGKYSHFQVHMKKLLQTVKKKSDIPMYAFSRESCPLCKKVYLSRKTLRAHLLQHTANDIVLPGRSKPGTSKTHSGLICIVCKRFFSSRNTLKHHALTAHKKIFLEDPLIFGIQSSISVTSPKKPKNTAYQCEFCCKVFYSKSTFKFHRLFHLQSVDSSKTIPNTSDRKVNTAELLAPLHASGSPLTDKQEIKKADGRESETNTILNDESKHSSFDESSHLGTEYESCRVECRSGFSLRPLHRAILNCHICQISIRKDEYTDHLLKDHKWRVENIYTCSFCDLKFPSSSLAGEHLKQCSLDSQCILCKEQLPSIKLLKNHVVQGHRQTWADYISRTGAKTKIGIDNGGLKIASTLAESSSMESPRTCLLCQATFNDKSVYISHLQGHTKTCMIFLHKLDDHSQTVSQPKGKLNKSASPLPQDLSSCSHSLASNISDPMAEVSGEVKEYQCHVSRPFKLTLKLEKPNDGQGKKSGTVSEHYLCASNFLEKESLILKQDVTVPKESDISKTEAWSCRSKKLNYELHSDHAVKVVRAKKRAIINSRTNWEDCSLPKTIKLTPSNSLENVDAFEDKLNPDYQ